MTTPRYFEDFEAGQDLDLGSIEVTRDDIVEFATEFDPQDFHVSEEGGKASMLGGLAASGWHTASIVMRLLATNLFNKSSGRGSPGVSRLKWKHPVFPGDVLSASAKILATKELRSKPLLGMVFIKITAINQNGTEVIEWENPVLFEKQEASE
ncbi:MaoC family dehydratase [Roseibium sp. HPY-6]|uniref:MaoC family dehydratase n=1 Tax=Roseibium sp. HPY-6 TaxID=3229852 RepID=UPI0033902D74